MAQRYDWGLIRIIYESGEFSTRRLCALLGCSRTHLRDKANQEHWAAPPRHKRTIDTVPISDLYFSSRHSTKLTQQRMEMVAMLRKAKLR